MSEEAPRSKRYRVLAIDGGGIRGIIPAMVLEYLERKTRRKVSQLFDLVAGTSTGGLLALALARQNALSAGSLASIYDSYGPQIFGRSVGQAIRSLGTLNGAKYDNGGLVKTARAMLGSAKMGDAATNVIVTAYNITKREPAVFTSYGAATRDCPMTDAGLATSAAPTYFPPYQLHNGYHVDGGTVDNNPALTGVIELCRLKGCTVRDVDVLSLGCGSDMEPIDGAAAKDWGILSWATPLVSIFTDGTSSLHEYHLRMLLPDENVTRLQCSVRGNVAQMDNVSAANLANLHRVGDSLIESSRGALDRFIAKMEELP